MAEDPTLPRRGRNSFLGLLGVVLIAGVVIAARPAGAVVTSDEAARWIAAAYAVEVLRVRSGTVDGTAVWLITVMKPGADSNDAFQVTILAVDKETGKLVPAFRHRPSGTTLSGGGRADTQIQSRPDVLRSRAWR